MYGVGTSNDGDERLRTRTGMKVGMKILMAALDLDVCIYSL